MYVPLYEHTSWISNPTWDFLRCTFLINITSITGCRTSTQVQQHLTILQAFWHLVSSWSNLLQRIFRPKNFWVLSLQQKCSPFLHQLLPRWTLLCSSYVKFKAEARGLKRFSFWVNICIYGSQKESSCSCVPIICKESQVQSNSYYLLSYPKAATISQAVTSQAPALEMHYSWHDYVGMIYNCKLDTNLIISAR